MENFECNSFYAKNPAQQATASANVTNNITEGNSATAEQAIPIVKESPAQEAIKESKADLKKRSTLWIWAASYFGAILLSPDENPNYKDNSSTNVTP